jgi:hypothetical protein
MRLAGGYTSAPTIDQLRFDFGGSSDALVDVDWIVMTQ